MCGGNPAAMIGPMPVTGTSPRVRGKLNGESPAGTLDRYIPACAGETAAGGVPPPVHWVHPRVCGGNSFCTMDRRSSRGTSPRVRGKLEPDLSGPDWPRYIPACAGETMVPSLGVSVARVHPRVCGGNVAIARMTSPQSGTSPRVRGKPHFCHRWQHPDRYIPACAGETQRHLLSHSRKKVHPRVCGGNAQSVEPCRPA